ncbi:MAG: hypothetical protein QG675_79 [Patescibacteria group bacterium]|jgi:hypothetical protein|nr:hypothetical protein [Patescibacteria group bacterium]
MKKFSRYLLLAFLSISVIAVTLIITANPALARCGDDDQADFQNSGTFKCGDEDWHYDPVRSANQGRPIWVDSKGDYLRIISGSRAEIVSIDSNNVTDEVGLDDYENITRSFQDDEGRDYCSMDKPVNCVVWDGEDYSDYEGPPEPGEIFNTSDTTVAKMTTLRAEIRRIQGLLEDARAAADAQDACEDRLNSPLSFVLCPLMNFMTDALTTVIESLERALTNPDLTSSSELRTALSSMINIANSFYILIFLIIIFSNFIAIPGLDNYTIKKTLPKLIAAIILTQFSLLICQTILDIGNILATTIPTTLLEAFGLTGDPASAFAQAATGNQGGNTAGNLGDLFESVGQFLLLGLTILVGIVVGVIALFYLVMRYLFMVLLVLAVPFAFAAWVLPNTEQYFKKWWTMFIKLSLMYLLVSLLFAGGAIFRKLLTDGDVFGSNNGENFLASLIGLFVPIVVLALVPKTLKLSGDIMAKSKEAAQKGFQGAKDTYAGKKITKSAQEGKLAEQKGKAYEKFGQSGVLGAKRSARLEAKGAGLKSKAGEQIKSDVGSLGLDRQIELAKNSKNADVKKAAQKAIDAKRRELANTRNIDASQLGQQLLLKHDGNRAAAESELKAHLQRAGVAGASNAQLGSDGRVSGDGLDLRATFENPEFPDYKSGGGTGASTPQTPTSSMPPPSPPPGGGNNGGATNAGGTPRGAPNRRTGATPTPTPTPAPTPGPRPTPTPRPTLEPPEPPPGTTE